MENVVVVTRCPSYDEGAVRAAVVEAVRPFGGFGTLVRPGQRVALKVNLLRGAPPAKAVTTHPAVVAAVAAGVRAAGGTPVVVDSPGAGLPHTRATLEKCYRRSELLPPGQSALWELNYDTTFKTARHADGIIAKRFNVLTPILQADAVINLPKLKTHAFTILTGAVKNLFGVVPGYDKPGFHARLRTVDNFAQMLLDIALYTRPVITIMDAITAMEGNGPGLGTPRDLGLLLAGRSPLATDVVAAALLGLPTERHPVVRAAAGRGLTPARPEDVHVVGADLAAVTPANWKWPPTIVSETGFAGYGRFQGVLAALVRSGLSVQPRVSREKCTGCGNCRETCPVGAIEVVADKSFIEERLCIRCYCCHEACGYDAIELKRSLLNRVVGAFQ